jgi:DNA-binding SARP family transcriptional activator/Tfp pilus assembly protein PilF
MRFQVLGPLRVLAAGGEVPVTARRERVVLAMLVLHANHPVPVSELVEAVWTGRPPRHARNQLQGCVSRLRAGLARAGGAPEVIVTDPAGYRLRVDPAVVDLCEQRRLRDEARAAVAAGHADEAVEHYRTALGLWRGAALSGLDGARIDAAAAALEEERLLLREESVLAELDLGRAGELVVELSALVRRHPYRERLHGALMLALYRAGRPADALASYRRAHRLLREELGTEPGDELRQLHRAILNRDPDLAGPRPDPVAGPAAAPPPRELPHQAAGFIGRDQACKELDELLDRPDGPAVVPIAVITGPAGVGKTALAVYWGHRVAGRFPDGQLYLDLRGCHPDAPVRPIEALAALLRSLGTPANQVPTEVPEAAAQFRSRLAGRRVLLVLDDAGTVDQVRPLVPGSAGCFALVTSRDRLTGLAARDGASRLPLAPLDPPEAWRMLAGCLGQPRARAEPVAVAELARLCAFLPLALRIAAANLADRPGRTVADYVAELTGGDRLAALRVGGDQQSAVRAAFELSYRALPADQRRLFRRLGLAPGPDLTAPAAAALVGATVVEARRLLDRLAAIHLVREHSPGRFTCHDLLRQYASQLVEAEEAEPDRAAAIDRLLTGYLLAADAAARLLHPQLLRLPGALPAGVPLARFDRTADALAWLDAERANLVAAVTYRAGRRHRPPPWLLADRLRGYFRHGRHMIDWLRTARTAVAAAERAGDLPAQAAATFNLADAYQHLLRHPDAVAHYTTASELAGRAGWRAGQAAALTNLGTIHQLLGRLDLAADHHARALAVNRELGVLTAQAVDLVNLAGLECLRGRLQAGADHLVEALELTRRLGHEHAQVTAMTALGFTYRALGRLGPARAAFTKSLAMARATGNRSGESTSRYGLGAVHHDEGRYAEAQHEARQAASLAAEIGDPTAESNGLRTLGSVQLRLGRPDRARAYHRRSLELARRAGNVLAELGALNCLADSSHRAGDSAAGRELAGQALTKAQASGYRVFAAEAVVTIAEILLDQGDHPAAREHAERALTEHLASGYHPGQLRARTVLARLGPTTGGPPAVAS